MTMRFVACGPWSRRSFPAGRTTRWRATRKCTQRSSSGGWNRTLPHHCAWHCATLCRTSTHGAAQPGMGPADPTTPWRQAMWNQRECHDIVYYGAVVKGVAEKGYLCELVSSRVYFLHSFTLWVISVWFALWCSVASLTIFISDWLSAISKAHLYYKVVLFCCCKWLSVWTFLAVHKRQN
jgi:hypothetical protein